MRVMLVHAEGSRCQALSDALRQRGVDVVVATSARAAVEALQATPVGALVGELRLCTAEAPVLADWIAEHLPTLPVAYLLHTRRVEEVIRAIHYGCVDVIVASDAVEATAAEVAATLARHQRRIQEHWLLQNILALAAVLADAESPTANSAPAEAIAVGHVQLNANEQTVIIAEPGRPVRRVRLTAAECRLLAALMSQAGSVISVETLAHHALGYRHRGRDVANAVRHHIVRLREKIETDPARPILVHTVRGRGYVFDPDRLA